MPSYPRLAVQPFALFTRITLLFAVSLSYGATEAVKEFVFDRAPFSGAHASTVVELRNGDLMSAWFGGTEEGAPDVAIWSSTRNVHGWSRPIELARENAGGNPWASTFLDSFRDLDQMGRLSRRGVQVHMHNTLTSSDYGLLDENTFTPRPNYWAALLWRKLMGPAVLDSGHSPAPSLHLYTQCLRGQPGGASRS